MKTLSTYVSSGVLNLVSAKTLETLNWNTFLSILFWSLFIFICVLVCVVVCRLFISGFG